MPESLVLTPSQKIFLSVDFALLLAGVVLWFRVLVQHRAAQIFSGEGRLSPWKTSWPEFLVLPCLAFILSAVLQSLVLFAGHIDVKSPLTGPETLAAAAAFQGGFIVAVIAYQFLPVAQPPKGRIAPMRAAAMGLFALLLCLPLIVAVSLAWESALKHFGLSAEPQELIAMIRNASSLWEKAAWVILVVVGAPVAEELFFRRGIFHFLSSRYNHWFAAVVSAALFSAMHRNLFSSLPLFGLGVALALAYRRTGCIISAMVIHALFNLNSIIPILLGLAN